MALVNNIFELKSDAFKITVHHRRPVPVRTDTIGPWLEALSFLTWLSALTNSALVYLFSPSLSESSSLISFLISTPFSFVNTFFNATTITQEGVSTTPGNLSMKASEHLVAAAGAEGDGAPWGADGSSGLTFGATKDLLVKAALVALVASHAYLIVRAVIRHVVEKIWWKGSKEVVEWEREDQVIKERFLKGGKGVIGDAEIVEDVSVNVDRKRAKKGDVTDVFWEHDEGVDEIQRIVKEA